MTVRREILRRIGSAAARTAAMGSAVMLLVTVWGLSVSGVPQASAATNAGPAAVIVPNGSGPGAGQKLASGGSATPFSFRLPSGAACTGDSAMGEYRVQSYMVPAAVNPDALQFNSQGPVPAGVGAAYRQPLFDTTSSAYVNAQTANALSPGGPGPVVNIPGFDFVVFNPGDIPAGTYNIGIACTLGPPSPTQLDKYWNARMIVSTAPADVPAQITWTIVEDATTTTTGSTSSTSTSTSTTTSTSTPSSSTSSTSSSSTSSTSTSSTSTSSTTSTTRPSTSSSTTTTLSTTLPTQVTLPTTTTTTGGGTTGDSTTTTAAGPGGGFSDGGPSDGGVFGGGISGGGSPSGPSVGGSVSGLPVTGSTTTGLVVWGVLLLVFGRVAVLLGRPPRARPAHRA